MDHIPEVVVRIQNPFSFDGFFGFLIFFGFLNFLNSNRRSLLSSSASTVLSLSLETVYEMVIS